MRNFAPNTLRDIGIFATALPGSTLEDVSVDACTLAVTEWRDVEFVFNGHRYLVKYRDIIGQVKKLVMSVRQEEKKDG